MVVFVYSSCSPMDLSSLSSSIHGISQARILECVGISFSRRSSWPRDRVWVFCIAGRRLNLWAPGKPLKERIYRLSQNKRIINVFLESLLSESFPSLGVTVHFTSLGCLLTLCWSLDLMWGQLRIWSGPTPLCSHLQCPQLSELACFLLWELSMTFNILHRHRVCLVDCVDLIYSLYSSWEGLGSSSLVTLPLGFNRGFISTSACGWSTGVCSWSCSGGFGFAPVRVRCGGGAAAWVTGVLAAPGAQGSWQLRQQEI